MISAARYFDTVDPGGVENWCRCSVGPACGDWRGGQTTDSVFHPAIEPSMPIFQPSALTRFTARLMLSSQLEVHDPGYRPGPTPHSVNRPVPCSNKERSASTVPPPLAAALQPRDGTGQPRWSLVVGPPGAPQRKLQKVLRSRQITVG